jgi:hypothetical protein
MAVGCGGKPQGTDTLVQNYDGKVVEEIKIITHGRFVAIHNRSFNLFGSIWRPAAVMSTTWRESYSFP